MAVQLNSMLAPFVWDDTDVPACLPGLPELLDQRIAAWRPRSRMAFVAALVERIVAVVDPANEFESEEMTLALWLASIDSRYLTDRELVRSDWRGPRRGLTWCAFSWAQDAHREVHEGWTGVERSLCLLLRLHSLVFGSDDTAKVWCDSALTRLDALARCEAPTPVLPDLLGRWQQRRWGHVVSRALLDPIAPIGGLACRTSMAQLMKVVSVRSNSYLRAPQAMIVSGFGDTPYSFIPEIG